MINEFVPVGAVWTHYDSPTSPAEIEPAVRVMASIDRPGEFVFQIRDTGRVTSARLSLDVLAEVHRQAMRA